MRKDVIESFETTNWAEYAKSVDRTASEPTKSLAVLINRMQDIGCKVDVARLLHGTQGLCAEAGELQEVLKKILFQGKPASEENLFHMKRELGDIVYYWVTCCMALGIDPNEVVSMNVNKLTDRYPKGFEVDKSENRKQGDL